MFLSSLTFIQTKNLVKNLSRDKRRVRRVFLIRLKIMRQIINLFSQILAPAAGRFQQALENPRAAQQRVQNSLFQSLIKSEYGKYFQNWHDIPIIEYQNIETLILGQKEINKPLLTDEKIIFYEKTSGTSNAAKLIPYTKSLRRSFNHMFCVWAYDLITNGPKFNTGKIYFCISPSLTHTHTLAVQNTNTLQDDSEYLDIWLRWILSLFLVSPPGVNTVRDAQEFKHKLSLALLKESKLEIISIWSPSFLKVIIDYIQENYQQLASSLKNKISPVRYQLILHHIHELTLIWPQLKLISCWDSANAADGAEFLRKLFPGVLVQGKGLLATEAPMTIPLIPAGGCVPVLDEVFFEFLDNQGNIYLLHELEKGNEYEIIISQKGGFYRYKIKDRVRVTHFYYNTPCLEFLGRTQEISDLVGEKLHLEFVRQVLDNLPLTGACFKSLVPVKQPQEHYVLLVDSIDINPQEIAELLDNALQESPQYRRARLLGQLAPASVIVNSRVAEVVALYKIDSGKKWGDLKHELLMTAPVDDLLSKI